MEYQWFKFPTGIGFIGISKDQVVDAVEKFLYFVEGESDPSLPYSRDMVVKVPNPLDIHIGMGFASPERDIVTSLSDNVNLTFNPLNLPQLKKVGENYKTLTNKKGGLYGLSTGLDNLRYWYLPGEIFEEFKEHDWSQYDNRFKDADRERYEVLFALGLAGIIGGQENN